LVNDGDFIWQKDQPFKATPLVDEIKSIIETCQPTYGYRRVHAPCTVKPAAKTVHGQMRSASTG